MDRRSFITAATASLALAVPAAAVAATAPMQAASHTRGDDRFWAAHREYQRILSEWNSNEDDEAAFDLQSVRETEALVAMLMIPVSTAAAVLAKFKATDGQDVTLPYPAKNSLQMMEWDLGRLMAKELV